MPTKIEWTTETWNPVTGCTPVSEGCANCYARRMANRLAGRFGYPALEPFRVTYHRDKINQPWHWRKPRMIFVCSMGDLFHPDVQDGWITDVFWRMWAAPQHTFQVLTKRPGRMLQYMRNAHGTPVPDVDHGQLTNVWFGVSVENQEMAEKRIPLLLECPAALRFASVEPMLGWVDLRRWMDARCSCRRLGWVICGAETCPGARRMDWEWPHDLRDQCARYKVPFFFKRGSDGSRLLGGAMSEQMPEVRAT